MLNVIERTEVVEYNKCHLAHTATHRDTIFILCHLIHYQGGLQYIGEKTHLPVAGQFSFDLYSGQMSFLPNVLQDALIVNQVTEYKNGVAVGSSVREMTFIVLDNLGSFNNIQHTTPSNISGGALTGT